MASVSSIILDYLDEVPQSSVKPPEESFLKAPTPNNQRGLFKSQNSQISHNSLYSPISNFSDDEDLQSVRLSLEQYEKPAKHSFWHKKTPVEDETTHHEALIWNKLKTDFYTYEKTETLHVNWRSSAEVFFFGETLDKLFSEGDLIAYLSESSFELGEVTFSNLNLYHKSAPRLADYLPLLSANMVRFDQVLDLYAATNDNIRKPELFEVFSAHANQEGLCIPLAIAMLGEWLLSYKSTESSNFDNPLIMNYFRKAARMALAVDRLQDLFEQSMAGQEEKEVLHFRKYWTKDNKNALALSLHCLGQYYQHIQNHDVAVTLWELNCHLTSDKESGNLAILGLTDGFGFGNRIKERNHLGRRSKTNRFNTKRRIAHIYRILMKTPGFEEYGTLWALKEKYD